MLSQGAAASWEETAVYGPGPVVKVGPGDYRMWYEGFGGSDLGGGDLLTQTGYATSTDGLVWTKYGSNPVLVPSAVNWENSEASICGVVYNASGSPANFEAWYHGGNNTGGSGGGRAIGYATSSDGITWTKYGSNPVMVKGAGGAWDNKWAADAKVLKFGATDYRMWYGGVRTSDSARQIGYATSTDGIAWTKSGSNPIFSAGSSGAWDDGAMYAFCPLYDASIGGWHAWYSASDDLASPTTSGLGYAYSSDGIAWTRGQYNPVEKDSASDFPLVSIHAYRDISEVKIVYGSTDNPLTVRRKQCSSALIEREVPTGVVVDDFNRADDASPPPGASWTNGVLSFTAGEGLAIVSNQVTRKSTGGYRQGGWFNGQTFGPDVCMLLDITAYLTTAGNGFLMFARLRQVGAGTTDGYVFNHDPAGLNTLWRIDDGSTPTIAGEVGGVFASGDKVALCCLGSEISAWHKPSAGDWTRILVAIDQTYYYAGNVGIEVLNNQEIKLDNLSIGPIPIVTNDWSRFPKPKLRRN